MNLQYRIGLVLTVAVLYTIRGTGANFNHHVSLEHKNNDLIFKLKPKEDAADAFLSMKLDFGHEDMQEEDKVKERIHLRNQFQKINDDGGLKETHDERAEPKLGLSVVKSRVDNYRGTVELDDNCLSFSIKSQSPDTPLSTCIKFENGVNWFNSFESADQYWPMEKMKVEKRPLTPLEFDNQAIAEPYFLNSKGLFLYFSPSMTSFFSVNSDNPATNPMHDNQFCVYAEKTAPYFRNNRFNYLNFTACKYDNPKIAHMKAVDYLLGKPRAVPDTKMVQYPIWTTWAKYKFDIDEKKVLEYAKSIVDHNFPNSQLEIDDNWEVCYGSAVVDKTKFPQMKKTISDLKAMGFRTTMWVHPFVNFNCHPYYGRFRESDILVKNLTTSYATSWWDSKNFEAAHFDFSRPDVRDWYVNRLNKLREEIGVDSFKFDAGESSFAPQVPQLDCPEHEHPGCITRGYVEAASRIGPMIEFRTGVQTQYLPNYVRMLDRNSDWTYHVGLPSLITTIMMFNIAGYPFVMPDMIGGNVYENQECTEEMFVRWTQANVFMPIMQFSLPPWDYSQKVIDLTRKFVDLHYHYSTRIIDIMKKTVQEGTPVNPPIWWADPTDPVALACNDEFLLGEEILVAPVIREGATSRDIYLPSGVWRDEADANHPTHRGPKWLRNYPAPLEVLPYFTKV